MTRGKLERRLDRLEAGSSEQRLHVFRLAPDGTRERISGEGEPRRQDLVILVRTHFPDDDTEIELQPKED